MNVVTIEPSPLWNPRMSAAYLNELDLRIARLGNRTLEHARFLPVTNLPLAARAYLRIPLIDNLITGGLFIDYRIEQEKLVCGLESGDRSAVLEAVSSCYLLESKFNDYVGNVGLTLSWTLPLLLISLKTYLICAAAILMVNNQKLWRV